MGPVVDEQAYGEVMQQLSAFSNKMFEHCTNMQTAAQACQSSMGDDPAAERSVAALTKCLSDIQRGIGTINQVRAAMARELEDARRAAQKAQEF